MSISPRMRIYTMQSKKLKLKKHLTSFVTVFLSCFLAFFSVGMSFVYADTSSYPTGTVVVKKVVVNNNGGTKVASDFIMHVVGLSGVPSGGSSPDTYSISFPGDAVGNPVLLGVGFYKVTETQLPGYTAVYSSECSSTTGGVFAEGETRTCTITNYDIAPKLTVVVNVTNDNGGAKLPQDFTVTVTSSTTPTTSFAGSATGTQINLFSGPYSVHIPSESGYDMSYSSECAGSLDIGQTATCTITINDTFSGGSSGGGSSTPTGADITINKIASLVTANAHDTFTYTLTVTNNGPETASSVSVSDVLDSKVTFVSASSSMGSYASSTGEWLVGDLANGQSAVLEITVSVNASVSDTTIPNIATASSTTSDPSNSNNTSSVNVTVNTSGGGGGSGSGGGPAPSGGGSSGGSGVPTVPSPTPTGQGEVLGTSTLNTTMPTSGLSMPENAGEVLGAATTAQLPRTGAGWLITLLSAVVAGIVAFGVSGYRLKF